jgi:hypothetical protein
MMDPLPDLPDLRIVETDHLQPHEEVDASRLGPLIESIRADGLLRNPPVVAQLRGETERYIVLDGANRTIALRQMKVPYALVQVVHPQLDSIRLHTWNQVIQSAQPDKALQAVQSIPGISIEENDLDSAIEKLRAGMLLAFLNFIGGETWEISWADTSLQERIQNMADLITTVEGVGPLERTGQTRAADLEPFFPKLAGLLVLHNFVVEEVMIAAASGIRLPSGITRFVISPRALRLNYPLERLASDTSRQIKQDRLDEWVKGQLKDRSIRYYAESTFLFDE